VIESHVSAGTFMGTVLVARDGAVIVDRAYGLVNVEWDVPNTTATKFRLGSVTSNSPRRRSCCWKSAAS
jgi:CubicO group peptidase (beta-lactamase class C family)